MEVKCKVCGTINDSNNNVCLGCYLPLNKTMKQVSKDVEKKVNEDLNKNIEEQNKNLINHIRKEAKIDVPKEPKKEEKTEVKKADAKTKDENKKKPETIKKEPIKKENQKKPIKKEKKLKPEKTLKSKKNSHAKKVISLILRFDIILVALTVISILVLGYETTTTINIFLNAILTFVILIIASLITFKNVKLKIVEKNKALSYTFISIIVFETILRLFLFYISKLAYLYYYIFITILYMLIAILIVNFIDYLLKREKSPSPTKHMSHLNTLVLIIIFIFLIVGVVTKMSETEIFKTDPLSQVQEGKEVPDELNQYIDNINAFIIQNVEDNPEYEIPKTIDDVSFGDPEVRLDEVNLTTDDFGTIESGTLTYYGVVYKYEDGLLQVQD